MPAFVGSMGDLTRNGKKVARLRSRPGYEHTARELRLGTKDPCWHGCGLCVLHGIGRFSMP